MPTTLADLNPDVAWASDTTCRVVNVTVQGRMAGEVYVVPTTAGTQFLTLVNDWGVDGAADPDRAYRPIMLATHANQDAAAASVVAFALAFFNLGEDLKPVSPDEIMAMMRGTL